MQVFKNTVVAKAEDINLVLNEVMKIISFVVLNNCELYAFWSNTFTGEARRVTRKYAVVKNNVMLFNFEVRIWENHAYIMRGRSRRTPLGVEAYRHGYHWVPTTLEALKNKALPTGRIIQGSLYELTEL